MYLWTGMHMARLIGVSFRHNPDIRFPVIA